MLTVMTGQPLVNYIAANEPATRPHVLHCIVTPEMDARYASLRDVLAVRHPTMEVVRHDVASALDSAAVHALATGLLATFRTDEWLLNRTTGTEQLRAPLASLFEAGAAQNRQSFFVQTGKGNIAFARSDWTYDESAFSDAVSVQDYFSLIGMKVQFTGSVNRVENELLAAMKKLRFDSIHGNCVWLNPRDGGKTAFAEYDCVATSGYRLFVFERKHYNKQSVAKGQVAHQVRARTKNMRDSILHDIEKLAYTRHLAGAAFAQVYWVFTGDFEVSDVVRQKAGELGIRMIEGQWGAQMARFPQQLGLPPPQP
jgi:hypothetical protein